MPKLHVPWSVTLARSKPKASHALSVVPVLVTLKAVSALVSRLISTLPSSSTSTLIIGELSLTNFSGRLSRDPHRL